MNIHYANNDLYQASVQVIIKICQKAVEAVLAGPEILRHRWRCCYNDASVQGLLGGSEAAVALKQTQNKALVQRLKS